MNQKIVRQKITEWLDNPITLLFKKAAEEERQAVKDARGPDCYHAFEPQKTQEILANLNGCLDTWDFVLDTLDGQGLFEEDDE